jgi:hypothetical protein
MKKNMGSIDKGIRLAIALLIIVLDLTNVFKGTLGDILLIVAVILVITTFLSFCPLYTLFGWNTDKKTK